MKNLKIGIDIDNVIAESYPAYIARFNQTFGTKIRYEEIEEFYYFDKLSGIDQEKVEIFIDRLLIDEDFQLNISPVEGVKKIIAKWVDGGDSIHYITARPKTIRQITKNWLIKHGLYVDGVTLDLFEGERHTKDPIYKKRLVKNKGIDIFIEDIKEIAETMDIPVLLLDRPWNQGKLPENVKRVKDWKEIDKIVSKL